MTTLQSLSDIVPSTVHLFKFRINHGIIGKPDLHQYVGIAIAIQHIHVKHDHIYMWVRTYVRFNSSETKSTDIKLGTINHLPGVSIARMFLT